MIPLIDAADFQAYLDEVNYDPLSIESYLSDYLNRGLLLLHNNEVAYSDFLAELHIFKKEVLFSIKRGLLEEIAEHLDSLNQQLKVINKLLHPVY
jgi:hypothetical protein